MVSEGSNQTNEQIVIKQNGITSKLSDYLKTRTKRKESSRITIQLNYILSQNSMTSAVRRQKSRRQVRCGGGESDPEMLSRSRPTHHFETKDHKNPNMHSCLVSVLDQLKCGFCDV